MTFMMKMENFYIGRHSGTASNHSENVANVFLDNQIFGQYLIFGVSHRFDV